MIHKSVPPELWLKIKDVAQEHRQAPTPAERHLWRYLRDRQVTGIKFRRQHGLFRFILDFASLKPKIAIELDGPIHDRTVEYDALRQKYIEWEGFRVLRFKNEEVFKNLENVLTQITNTLNELS